MKFIKYPSIRRLTERAINEAEAALPQDTIFVVTEKLHGANMGIYCDGNQIKIAKRTCFIEDDLENNFYDSVRVADKYKENICELVSNWIEVEKVHFEGDFYFIFFGELFGGGIHKGTPYSKQQDFALFSILTVIENTPNNLKYVQEKGIAHFVDEDKILMPPYSKSRIPQIANYIGCPCLDILFRGSLKQCSQFANNFASHFTDAKTVSDSGVAVHGQEAIDYLTITEGIIIEPELSVNHHGNSFIFKSKNAKFEEKYDTGYKPKISAREKALNNLTEEQADILYDMDAYVTRPRFDAVVSKIGEVTIKDTSLVLRSFIRDVLDEMKEDDYNAVLTKDMMTLFTGTVQNFIKPILLEMTNA